MFGRDEAEMIGQSIDRIIDASDHPLVHAAIARVRGGGMPIAGATPLTGVRASGERSPGEIHWSHWHEDGAMHFGTIVRDMTERRREHDMLYRLANFDSLTGVANRNLMQTELSAVVEAGEAAAILVADLGGFTDINNTLGHAAGDQVLLGVAERLGATLSETDLLARSGGAAFTILARDRGVLALDALAHAILAAIAEPVVVDGHEVRLAGTIGIAVAPAHGTSAAELIGSAELALFQARQRGPGTSFHFVPALRAEAVARRDRKSVV